MKLRFKAFGLHLLGSSVALTITLGLLYLGWYRWPGWYLADVPPVIAVMVGVDVVLGPLLTLVIASSKKSRRALFRDIAVIVSCQLIALTYGTITLWQGRPLYYAFSVNCLSIVQAYEIDPQELSLARRQRAELAPHWYSVPRWIWAPLPQDPAEAVKIVTSVVEGGGSDVTAMPRLYKRWEQGLPELRAQLQKVDQINFFSRDEKAALKRRMRTAGIATDQPDAIALMGRGRPLLAVVDPASLKITAILRPT
jgi:hypothetical protein